MKSLTDELATQRRKVDFDTYDISVQQLLSMLDQSTIDVAPEYQRHFRWSKVQQSNLIESVFLGLPVPSVFMATNKDGSWEVVDGVQRLSTLVHFAGSDELRAKLDLDEPLIIKGLEKLESLNGQKFRELPEPVRLQFVLRPIKVITLSDKSDLVVRFDLFERLNTGGVKLSDQEIRACVFRGPFNDLLRDLASNPDFRAVVNLPPRKKEDRTDEEMVLRFFAYFDRYEQFDHSVIEFLNDFMRDVSKESDLTERRRLFEKTFKALAALLPDGIRRSSRRTTPMNLYEAVAVGAALAIEQNGRLTKTHSMDWVDGPELKALTKGATNQRSMVVGRIEHAAKHLGWTSSN